MVYWYFKLFNNIKSEHEAKDLARLELESLFGSVEPILNFADKLCEEPLCRFMKLPERIQDYIIHELPYGKIQGYFGKSDVVKNLDKLVKRLAYTREIYLVVTSDQSPEGLAKIFFPSGVLGKNFHFFKVENYVCFRVITHQYFLEKSEYISKLSRNEQEVARNVDILFSYLINEQYRIPASSTLSIGKRLQDYFAIREEPSLYLTHYFHPYKGKFHPKMARALLNYIYPHSHGLLLDNFAGSGTLFVETTLMELDSKGIDINPLSVLMSNVKCKSLLIDLFQLKKEIDNYFEKAKDLLTDFQFSRKGRLAFYKENNFDFDKIKLKSIGLSNKLKNYFRSKNEIISQVLICRELLNGVKDELIKEFLLLVLSGTISDVLRRTSNQFLDVFRDRANNLYLRLFLFKKLNEVLKIKLGKSETYVGDARNTANFIGSEEIDGIVTSPPYSIALDYIKNDFPQLVLLELTESLDKLNEDMIGNPRLNIDRKNLFSEIEENANNPLNISKTAREIINTLLTNERRQAGLRSFKFFKDMFQSLKDMYRVMKKGAKCAIVIGNNHFMVKGNYVEVPNDVIVLELARKIGFTECQFIGRELQKSSEGNINEESIVILQKEDIKNGEQKASN